MSGGSARRAELLEAAYRYALKNGTVELSLRPLASSTGTSPRVLLFLFGSKDELIREILDRARREQRELLAAELRAAPAGRSRAAYLQAVDVLWTWLTDPAQRDTIRLFLEAYATSLRPDPGPWAGFAERSVAEWLDLLGRFGRIGAAERTATLAVLRGLLLDLLATDDLPRARRAYRTYRRALDSG